MKNIARPLGGEGYKVSQ